MLFKNIKRIMLIYSIFFLVASLMLYTRFNWDNMSNFEKMIRPIGLTCISLIFGVYIGEEKYRSYIFLFSGIFLGISLIYGNEIYLFGLKNYQLYGLWSMIIMIPAVITRYYSLISLFTVTYFLSFKDIVEEVLDYKYESLIPLSFVIIVLLYPTIIEKFKFKYNSLYYYMVTISYVILVTLYTYGNNNLSFNLFYLSLVGVIYYTGWIKFKKIYIQPITVIQLSLILTSIVSSMKISEYIKWIGMIIILGVALYVVSKHLKIKEKYISYFINILKFLLVLSIVGFIGYILTILKFDENYALLIVGGITLLISWFLYKGRDIIYFFSGILFIGVCILNISESFLLASFGMSIFYNLFWYFKNNKVIDLAFVPMNLTLFVLSIQKLFSIKSESLMEAIVLIILGTIIFGAVIFEEYYKKYKYIFLGNEITFVFFYLYIVLFGELTPFMTTGVAAYALSMLILLKSRVFVNQLIGIAVVEAIIFMYNIPMLSVAITLTLLYTYRKEKIAMGLSVFYCLGVIAYYFNGLNLSLLLKSIIALKVGIVLFIGYIIFRYLIKNNE